MAYQILGSIGKHLIVFCLTVILFVGVGFGLNEWIQPEYQAEASLVANIGKEGESIDNKYNEILANQMLTKTYGEVIQSQSIAKIVKDKLASPLSPIELLDKIQVKTDPGALILNIYARDENPNSAVDLANAFAIAFTDHSTNIMNQANVTILDLASYENSATPVSPKKLFNLAICLFIGITSGSSLALLLDRRGTHRSKKRSYKEAAISIP